MTDDYRPLLCDACKTRVAWHTVARGSTIALRCCWCFVAETLVPVPWHPECLAAYYARFPDAPPRTGARHRFRPRLTP